MDTTFHEELMVGAAASDKRLPVVPERHCAKAPRAAVPHALSGWRVPDPGTAGSAPSAYLETKSAHPLDRTSGKDGPLLSLNASSYGFSLALLQCAAFIPLPDLLPGLSEIRGMLPLALAPPSVSISL